jgi:hypothetical protein
MVVESAKILLKYFIGSFSTKNGTRMSYLLKLFILAQSHIIAIDVPTRRA